MIVAVRAIAITGDELGDELMQVGIVAYQQDPFAAGVLGNKLLKGREIAVWREGGRGEDGRFEANLSSNELGRLTRALERAGDDDVDLSLESGQNSGHQHALLLAFFDQAPFGVKDGIFARDARICVAHEIEVHEVQPGGF